MRWAAQRRRASHMAACASSSLGPKKEALGRNRRHQKRCRLGAVVLARRCARGVEGASTMGCLRCRVLGRQGAVGFHFCARALGLGRRLRCFVHVHGGGTDDGVGVSSCRVPKTRPWLGDGRERGAFPRALGQQLVRIRHTRENVTCIGYGRRVGSGMHVLSFITFTPSGCTLSAPLTCCLILSYTMPMTLVHARGTLQLLVIQLALQLLGFGHFPDRLVEVVLVD